MIGDCRHKWHAPFYLPPDGRKVEWVEETCVVAKGHTGDHRSINKVTVANFALGVTPLTGGHPWRDKPIAGVTKGTVQPYSPEPPLAPPPWRIDKDTPRMVEAWYVARGVPGRIAILGYTLSADEAEAMATALVDHARWARACSAPGEG